MSKNEKFMYRLGSLVYIPKFALKDLKRKESDRSIFSREIINDLYNQRLTYDCLPNMLKVKIVGCRLACTSGDVKVSSYTCICEYSSAKFNVSHSLVFAQHESSWIESLIQLLNREVKTVDDLQKEFMRSLRLYSNKDINAFHMETDLLGNVAVV